ncbi:hypothetical protein [Streptomyces exfoliatus]|uniref:hypothetical protein n=1 Tax=Streptomyces exfoliatus TaxID=1905 RepID=UPI00379D6197
MEAQLFHFDIGVARKSFFEESQVLLGETVAQDDAGDGIADVDEAVVVGVVEQDEQVFGFVGPVPVLAENSESLFLAAYDRAAASAPNSLTCARSTSLPVHALFCPLR